LEWQAAVLGLFETLLDRLAREGLWLEAWRGHGAHTRHSLAWFSGRDLSEPFSREELARACNLSPSQLDRVWRRETGITPRRHWDKLRLHQACEWLREDTRSIKEIAALLGFEHASHFSTWFHQMAKRSPRDYRGSVGAW
jgi:transcriptional regulator GlxA family with amidase domain